MIFVILTKFEINALLLLLFDWCLIHWFDLFELDIENETLNVQVKNNDSSAIIGFKFMLTNPKGYSIKPRMGVTRPMESIEVSGMFHMDLRGCLIVNNSLLTKSLVPVAYSVKK